MMQKSNRSGYLISLAAALSWSLTGPGVRYIQNTFVIDPVALAFWRIAIMAAALVIGLLLFRRDLLHVTADQRKGMAISGILGIGIYQVIFVTSIALNGAAVGIVLVYMFPVFVALGSWVLFKEPVRAGQVLSLALSLVGCALLVRVYDPSVLRLNPWGALIGLASAVAQAVYTLLNRRLAQTSRAHPMTTMTYTFGFGAMTLVIVSLVSAPQATFVMMPWSAIPAIAALSLGPTLVGYIFFNWGLTKLSGRIVSLISMGEVPLAALIGVFVLGEVLEPLQITGMVLVLLGIVLPNITS